jgi:hypothetical protein
MVSEGDGADAPRAHRAASEWSAFLASLPLFVVTVGLFAGSAIVYELARSVGPDGFPLWGLLMTLGFIAAIGTTVSWFFAKGAAEDAAAPAGTLAVEPEGGRPMPDVRRDDSPAATEDWDESTIPVRPSPRPPVAAVAVSAPGPDDVERALDEIADIEEELEGRRAPPFARSPAPARS